MRSSADIGNFLMDPRLGIRVRPLLRDEQYSLPTLEWVLGDFSRDLIVHQGQHGLATFKLENGDCDDYQVNAYEFSRQLHRLNDGRKPGARTGFAFGMFDFTIAENNLSYPESSRGGAHAINFALISTKLEAGSNGIELVFLDPQGAERKNLSPEEIASCDFLFI